MASFAALAACLGAVAALVLSTAPRPRGPLRATDITAAVHAFATAVAQHDAKALGRLLAPDVTEVSPGAVEHGRAAVLAQYSISGYALADVRVQPGWVGRASAQYAVLRPGQPDLSGQVTFGLERLGGRTVIGLITTQP
jgi:hypothetical protein